MQISDWRRLSGLIHHVLRYRLHHFIPTEQVSGTAAWITLTVLQRVYPIGHRDLGEQLKEALLKLGPVYIKLGQLLSTRVDLLGPEVAATLAQLQDRVEPIADFDIYVHVDKSLGTAWSEVFHSIAPQPLASASIAQVHSAELIDGSHVVIKVVRPGIEGDIEEKMGLLLALSEWLEKSFDFLQMFHLPRVIADQRAILRKEMNLYAEARNQIQLRRNFAGSNLLYVPRAYPEFSRRHLLVMEYVEGVPIGQLDRLRAAGVDFEVLAHKGVETFFTQVFEDNFFHADMHPGNILVDISDPEDPKYIALDCAIMGRLEFTDRRYLGETLLAFFQRDFARVAALCLDSGWVPPDTDPAELEAVIERICSPIFAKPLAEISFGNVVTDLLSTANQFQMEVQPQLVLLEKTLLYVEGLGRQLYPQLDLWDTGKPFMQRWAARHMGPSAWLEEMTEATPLLLKNIGRLPQILSEYTPARRRAWLIQEQTNYRLNREVSRLQRQQRNQRRGFAWILFASGVLLVTSQIFSDARSTTLLALGVLLSGIGVILLRTQTT